MCQFFSFVQTKSGNLYHCLPQLFPNRDFEDGLVKIYSKEVKPFTTGSAADPNSHTDICRTYGLSENIDGAAKYEMAPRGMFRVDWRPPWAEGWHLGIAQRFAQGLPMHDKANDLDLLGRWAPYAIYIDIRALWKELDTDAFLALPEEQLVSILGYYNLWASPELKEHMLSLVKCLELDMLVTCLNQMPLRSQSQRSIVNKLITTRASWQMRQIAIAQLSYRFTVRPRFGIRKIAVESLRDGRSLEAVARLGRNKPLRELAAARAQFFNQYMQDV